MQLAQVFAGPGVDVVMSQFGFAVYAIAAQAVGAMLHVAPALPADARMPRGHDLDAIAAAITPATRLVYLANPNNPTGTWFSRDAFAAFVARVPDRSEEHTSELQSLMRISYAVFCLKKKKTEPNINTH